MSSQLTKLAVIIIGLIAVILLVLLPTRAIADSRPQEVLDLIADHEALAMKIRPLNDRVLVRFKPDGVPVRAKVKAATDESNNGAEARVPERLRHKDRAASDGDDYGRIKVRLSALEKNTKSERERVMRPQFGADLSKRHKDIVDARKQLAALQREFTALEREVNALDSTLKQKR